MNTLPGSSDVARFRGWVADRLGLQFDESRWGQLAEVLRRRVSAGAGSCAAYLDRLAAGTSLNGELKALARDLTVTETYFFRSPDQFAAFTDIALPQRLAAAGPRCVQVLAAGCASGEEPYSLAIAVRKALGDAAGRVAVTAFDINPAMLDRAAQAQYSNWSLRDLPPDLQARWFRPAGSTFEVEPSIRSAVAFHERNLAQPDPDFWRPGRFDIVFCRNVLMYFTSEHARAAVERIARSLVPGGYLFLGHAETLRGLSNDFHLCHTHGSFYYQRKLGDVTAVTPMPARSEPWRPVLALADTSWVEAIQRASERIDALVPHSPAATSTPPAAGETRRAPDLGRALEHVHREQFGQALAQLEALPVAQAHDPDVLLLKAVSLSHSAALDAAQAVCRELLQRDELNAGAHYVLALCHEGLGDVQAAMEHDQAAAYLDPGFAMPHLHMGLMARRRGEHDTALRELHQAIALLQREDSSRLLLYGGGFQREALVALCEAQCAACAAVS